MQPPPSQEMPGSVRRPLQQVPRPLKKMRAESRDDILRALARDALDAMREQGLGRTRDRKMAVAAVCVCDNDGDGDVRTVGDEEETDMEPQSPVSFFRRVGFVCDEDDAPTGLLHSPISPLAALCRRGPFTFAKYSSSNCTDSPDDSAGPSFSRVPRSEPLGNVTPATAQAARCLLALMQ